MSARRVLLACITIASLAACMQPDGPIVIGVTGPFADATGRSMRLGAGLAVSEINARGGVRGRQIELLEFDDRGQAATAIQLARRFKDNGTVLAVIGPASSSTALAAAPVYNSADNPLTALSPTATARELGGTGPSVFRVCPDEVAHAGALAEWVRTRLGIRRVATLYHNDSESRTMAAAFRRAFSDRTGALLAEDPFSDGLPSFEPYLTRAAFRGGLQALLVVGGGWSIGQIRSEVDSIGLDLTVLGNVDLLPHAQAGGVDLEGALLSASYLPDLGGEGNRSFVAAYRQANGGQLPDHAAAGSYDIVYLIARAVERAGASRERIRTYLSGLGSETEPFLGVTGTIAFDRNGNLQRTSVEIGTVRGGVLVPALER